MVEALLGRLIHDACFVSAINVLFLEMGSHVGCVPHCVEDSFHNLPRQEDGRADYPRWTFFACLGLPSVQPSARGVVWSDPSTFPS